MHRIYDCSSSNIKQSYTRQKLTHSLPADGTTRGVSAVNIKMSVPLIYSKWMIKPVAAATENLPVSVFFSFITYYNVP